MTNDTLRAAITAALRRRDPNANLWQYPTESDRALWSAMCRRVEIAATAYGTTPDLDALRALAVAVGLRVEVCPSCGGRGRRAYGREVEDGCDECECSGVVVIDPAEEVERYRTIAGNLLARIHRDGGHHADAIGWERAADEADVIVARLYTDRDEARAEVDRLRAELALERDRCAGLVRELTAAPPGSRRTAASRNLAERVAACVRAIEVDDETATCARALVREARERAKAAEADVARLEFALQCEATRHEETRAAARSLIGVLGLYDPAIRDGLLTVQMRYIDDAREALRKIVDGDR